MKIIMAETKHCPYCGEEILTVAKKCKYCGKWLPEETSPVLQQVAPQAKRMTTCPCCAEEIEEGTTVCPYCHETLVQEEKPKEESPVKGKPKVRTSAVPFTPSAKAEVTLPEITQITEEVKGAGISGAFNGAFVGHIEAMTLTLNFRSVTADAVKLAEPRNHQLDLRAAQQYWDNTAGKFVQQAVKHVLMVTPTKFAPGKLAPAASAEASGEYAATYFATYIDGKKVLEIDIINFIYYVNGTDYLADVRKALGKA